MQQSIGSFLYSPAEKCNHYAISLIVVGVTAAVVAHEFRTQVEAALRESETRRQMEHLQHDLDVRAPYSNRFCTSMPQVAGWDIAAGINLL